MILPDLSYHLGTVIVLSFVNVPDLFYHLGTVIVSIFVMLRPPRGKGNTLLKNNGLEARLRGNASPSGRGLFGLLCLGYISAGSPLFRPAFGFVSGSFRKVLLPPSTQLGVVKNLLLDNWVLMEVAKENAGVVRINDLERVINYLHPPVRVVVWEWGGANGGGARKGERLG